MPDSVMFHEGNRRLQDEFDSRKISDRLEEKLTRTRFSDEDIAFVENSIFFFLATADAKGRPDCSWTPSLAHTWTTFRSQRTRRGRRKRV